MNVFLQEDCFNIYNRNYFYITSCRHAVKVWVWRYSQSSCRIERRLWLRSCWVRQCHALFLASQSVFNSAFLGRSSQWSCQVQQTNSMSKKQFQKYPHSKCFHTITNVLQHNSCLSWKVGTWAPRVNSAEPKNKAIKNIQLLAELFPFLLERVICFIADHMVTLCHLGVMINTLSLLLNI